MRVLLTGIIIGITAQASALTPSQLRPKDSSWEELAEADAVSFAGTDQTESVKDESLPYSELPLNEIPQWNVAQNGAGAQQEFERVRNLRFLNLPEMKSFLRRIPWLYPDDGCSMRAELASEVLSKNSYPLPKKLFVFGDLAVKTENSPLGWVYWWYHVAPVIYLEASQDQSANPQTRSEENVFVLDPAMSLKHPIRLKIWVESMVANVHRARLALCDSTAYAPSSPCHSQSSDAGKRATRDSLRFLRLEWFRLKGLGRDPRKELADQPPW